MHRLAWSKVVALTLVWFSGTALYFSVPHHALVDYGAATLPRLVVDALEAGHLLQPVAAEAARVESGIPSAAEVGSQPPQEAGGTETARRESAQEGQGRREETLRSLGLPTDSQGARFVMEDIVSIDDSPNDVFVWSWIPSVSGVIADNAFIGGQRVEIETGATIGGDLFLFAQTARIDGRVAGDVYSFCADLTIGPDALISGSIYGSSGALTLQGVVEGPLNYATGAMTVSGSVGGDTSVEVGELVIEAGARFGGDVRYESPKEASIDPEAVIEGDVRHVVPAAEEGDEEGDAADGFNPWSLAWSLWLYLGSFIVGTLVLAILGDVARRPSRELASQPARGLGFGFVVAVVLPAAALLALVLIITIPVGLLTLIFYGIALYMARLVAAHTVGDWLLRRGRGGEEPSAYLALAVGLVIFYLLLAIPFVGFLTRLAAFVAGLGGMFLAARAAYRPGDGKGGVAETGSPVVA